jgi:hypothetical protein
MSDKTITREQIHADPAAALDMCYKHGTLRVVDADGRECGTLSIVTDDDDVICETNRRWIASSAGERAIMNRDDKPESER